MKKDLFIKIFTIIQINLITYVLWSSIVYYYSIQKSTDLNKVFESNSMDLYKLSQQVESLTEMGKIDCVSIKEKKYFFFDSTEKFNCSNQFFIAGFFHSNNLKRDNIEIKYRVKNDTTVRVLLLFLLLIFNFLFFALEKYQNFLKQKEQVRIKEFEEKSKLSQRLAHDIRSPLSTLSLLSNKIQDPNIKKLQVAVISQINQIASTILRAEKSTLKQQAAPSVRPIAMEESLSYYQLLNNLKNEYTIKSESFNQSVSFQIDSAVREIAIHPPKFLYSIINNLIQNSIEATSAVDNGKVDINTTLLLSSKIEIKIIDNGKGIPKHILSVLGKMNISHGKEDSSFSGSGIGIYNARKDLENAGGSIEYHSIESKETTAIITLPVTLF